MAVFRFLINVDKCLDLTHYNCFFYKLKSSGDMGKSLFHLSEAQLPEGDPLSLSGAVSDIRMYLDKYAYDVDDYRIILLMRSVYTEATQNWEDTLLYRLLRLRYEFLKSNILLSTAASVEHEGVLNFVMLYDSDFAADQPDLTSYFSSDRLSKDVALLLEKYGVDPNEDDASVLLNAMEKNRVHKCSADKSVAEDYSAPFESDILLNFCKSNAKIDEVVEEREELARSLTVYVRDQLNNYRVYEQFVNRNNRRQETLAFLRLTDFINHNTEPPAAIGGTAAVSTLAQRCDKAWDEVWRDEEAQSRFAGMLARYSARLQDAERNLLQAPVAADMKMELPTLPEPSLIEQEQVFADGSEEQERRTTLQQKLEAYSKKKLFGKSFREEWNETHRNMVAMLENLKGSLRIYAQDLSRQYAGTLAKRKQDTLDWKDGNYVAIHGEQERLDIVEEKRTEILKELKKPHMHPALSFQDVLNSERELEQASKNISFYLDCLKETTFLNFLLLLAVCAGFFVLHYTILQPYNVSEIKAFVCYICYIGVAIALMGTMSWLPYRYYCGCVQRSIKDLNEKLNVYTSGYDERKKYFCEYINHINRLDYFTRQRDLLANAIERGRRLTAGQLWHREQIAKHREMLNFFSGLIESVPHVSTGGAASSVSVQSNGQILDVADCPIYWPQE